MRRNLYKMTSDLLGDTAHSRDDRDDNQNNGRIAERACSRNQTE